MNDKPKRMSNDTIVKLFCNIHETSDLYNQALHGLLKKVSITEKYLDLPWYKRIFISYDNFYEQQSIKYNIVMERKEGAGQ